MFAQPAAATRLSLLLLLLFAAIKYPCASGRKREDRTGVGLDAAKDFALGCLKVDRTVNGLHARVFQKLHRCSEEGA